MTKANLIHHILSTWAGENKISYTFEQQREVVKELSKWLMLKKMTSSFAKEKLK